MDIAHRIDLAMRKSGIRSQAELARRSGIPESTIARILKIGGNPSIETVAALAKILNVSIDWLVNGTDHPSPQDEIPDLLAWLSKSEMAVITSMRQSTDDGKALIINAARAASKKKIEDSDPSTNQS